MEANAAHTESDHMAATTEGTTFCRAVKDIVFGIVFDVSRISDQHIFTAWLGPCLGLALDKQQSESYKIVD